MTKLKILVSSYACGPYTGSEPGMGWNFVIGLSKYHEVHVIVEKRKWEYPIKNFLDKHPELNHNLTFYFIDKKRNKLLRKIWPPSYYWFYQDWQKKAYSLALRLDKEENFDLIHQLNMVGYREPGYLWKIEKPFVWGPIGGLENSPLSFLPSLGIKGMIFYLGRNIINWWQRNFKILPKRAANHNTSKLIAATPANAELIKKLWGKDAEVICEIGSENKLVICPETRAPEAPLKIIWSGPHTSRKNLPLLLSSLKRNLFPFELHILGDGEMNNKWKKIAKDLQIDIHCIWHGWLERSTALEIMKKGHVFCITSISDLTSTVTLEALSCGLPVVCLDHCGFAHVITDSCGIKIPVDTPTNARINIENAFLTLYKDENFRQDLSRGAINRAADFDWHKKIITLNTIYFDLLKI